MNLTNVKDGPKRRAVSGGAVAAVVIALIIIAAAAYIYANPPPSISGSTPTASNTQEYTFTNYGASPSVSTTSTSVSTAPNAVQIDIPSDNGYPFAQYTPQIVTVVIGVNNTVTWTNHDVLVHNMINPSGMFNSGDLGPGLTYTFTFTQPGSYPYYCSYHPSMSGIIVVKAGS